MPHKHTRRSNQDASNFNLPPSAIARPLPVGKVQAPLGGKKRQHKSSLRGDTDTPRAFARALQFQKTGKRPRDLDDGESLLARKKRKQKSDGEIARVEMQPGPANAQKVPKILPGERMSDFSARVNQALPISGLSRKGKSSDSVGERQTRLEKKIQRKIATWKAEEQRRIELEEERQDLAEQEDAEQLTVGEEDAVSRKKRKRQKGANGEGTAGDEDPWAALKQVRDKPRGLFDVAQAPPNITRIPQEKFKVKNGARVNTVDVPRAAGSLRKREELGSARQGIIESYRKLMESKRETA